MAGFLAGFGTGFFGGLVQQQEEARAENKEKRTRLMDHYLNVTIPQYHKTKAQATELRGQVDTLKGMGITEDDAIEAVKVGGGDISRAIDYARTYRSSSRGTAIEQAQDLVGTQSAEPQGMVSPTEGSQEALGSPQTAVATAAPGTTPEQLTTPQEAPTGHEMRPTSSVSNFWSNVVMGEKPTSALNQEITSEIAGLYGVSPEQVQGWMTSAWQTPQQMAGLEGRSTVSPVDFNKPSRMAQAEKLLDFGNLRSIPMDKREAFTQAVNNYVETGDKAYLDEAFTYPLDEEAIQKLDMQYTASTSKPADVTSELKETSDFIYTQFGDFPLDPVTGTRNLLDLDQTARTDLQRTLEHGESLFYGINDKDRARPAKAARMAYDDYLEGLIPGTSNFDEAKYNGYLKGKAEAAETAPAEEGSSGETQTATTAKQRARIGEGDSAIEIEAGVPFVWDGKTFIWKGGSLDPENFEEQSKSKSSKTGRKDR